MEIQDPGGVGKTIVRWFVVAVVLCLAAKHGYRAYSDSSLRDAIYAIVCLGCVATFAWILRRENKPLHKN